MDDVNLIKSAYEAPSEEIAQYILKSAGINLSPDDLQKTISTGTGLVAYDLQAPAKNLYPVATPVRNSIPRVGGGIGLATNWRQVNMIYGSGFDNSGWVPEGQRAGQMSYSTSTKSASYATLGEEDALTFEAQHAARTFEDLRASMTMRLLQKTFLKEEFGILYGNNSLQLGSPSAPTLSAAGSGATLPALTYSVIVVPLTAEGYYNSSVSAGVATVNNVTGADGKSFTINGGSGNRSPNTTQAITLGQTLSATVPVVNGAVAYAWYVGAAGAETLQAITTINSATFTAPLASGRQGATAITQDCSTNNTGATAWNGLLTTALTAGSNAYVSQLATGTAGTGTVLTPSGRGSVVEIDNALLAMWNNYQISPTVIYVHAQELKNITNKVLQSSSAGPLLTYFKDPDNMEYRLAAGGVIEQYFNPFHLDGGRKIPVKIHPKAVPGTIMMWCENLPVQYQSNHVPQVAEMKVRQDFYQIDWPLVTRQRQAGVYIEEVLVVYAPFAMGIIQNIGNG
jgi:hypothetical protein